MLPLVPAYEITIHESKGMTLAMVIVNLGPKKIKRICCWVICDWTEQTKAIETGCIETNAKWLQKKESNALL